MQAFSDATETNWEFMQRFYDATEINWECMQRFYDVTETDLIMNAGVLWCNWDYRLQHRSANEIVKFVNSTNAGLTMAIIIRKIKKLTSDGEAKN